MTLSEDDFAVQLQVAVSLHKNLARPERVLAGFARSSLAVLGIVAAARRRPSARFARLVELATASPCEFEYYCGIGKSMKKGDCP